MADGRCSPSPNLTNDLSLTASGASNADCPPSRGDAWATIICLVRLADRSAIQRTVPLRRVHRDSDHGHDDHDEDDGHSGKRSYRDRGGDDATGQPESTRADDSWEVRITDDGADAFLPGDIAIQAGESITWINHDDKVHTATGAGWDTGPIEPGSQVTVAFPDAGSFRYACQFHRVMTGSEIVEGGVATPNATPAATQGTRIWGVNLAHEPATLVIAIGFTVTWVKGVIISHTATARDETSNTGTIAAGATAEATFACRAGAARGRYAVGTGSVTWWIALPPTDAGPTVRGPRPQHVRADDAGAAQRGLSL